MLEQQGVPADFSTFLMYLFRTVLDGRNSYVADGVLARLGARASRFHRLRARDRRHGCLECPMLRYGGGDDYCSFDAAPNASDTRPVTRTA